MSHTDDTETRIVDGDSLGTRVIEKDKVQSAPPEGRGDHPTITGDTARQGPSGLAGASGAGRRLHRCVDRIGHRIRLLGGLTPDMRSVMNQPGHRA